MPSYHPNTHAYAALPLDKLQPLVERGDREAQYQAGRRYFKGTGVQQDFSAAAGYLRQAAEQGHPCAQCDLGVLYSSGQGVRQNDKMAYHWYSKSAEQGLDVAMVNLGKWYALGRGVKLDMAIARGWWEKAAALGNTEAGQLLAQYQQPAVVSPRKTWMVLLVVLSILPWAIFYTLHVAPVVHHFLGIDRWGQVKIGFYVFPIIAPQALLLGLLLRKEGKQGDG